MVLLLKTTTTVDLHSTRSVGETERRVFLDDITSVLALILEAGLKTIGIHNALVDNIDDRSLLTGIAGLILVDKLRIHGERTPAASVRCYGKITHAQHHLPTVGVVVAIIVLSICELHGENRLAVAVACIRA